MAGLCICEVHGAPVPRALPVDPEPRRPETEVVPRAQPLITEKEDPGVKVPRALPVLPEDPEILPKEDLPTPPGTGKPDPGQRNQAGNAADPVKTEKEEKPQAKKKPVFKLPPLPPLSGFDERRKNVGTGGSGKLGAAWETRTEARTLIQAIPAPRGQITDRNGLPLAQNVVGYFVSLKLPYLAGADDAKVISYAGERMRFASALLGADWSLSDRKILNHYKNRRWLPLPFSSMLTQAQKEAVEEDLGPGLELFPTYQRYYPEGGSACHIIGYVGKKAKLPTGPVAPGEPLWPLTEGREGLEGTFDRHLQGTPGSINFLFDANGLKLGEEIVRQPLPGKNIVTAIDSQMQQLAEKALADNTDRGAFVVMDVHSGDIYAMASRPTYDINIWIPAISNAEFKALQENPDLPLFPRAFRGQYPPASTFKVSVALAALESGVVDATTLVDCPTSLEIGNAVFHNWAKLPEGELTVVTALMRSCNTWFYTVGRETGGENLSAMALRLGFSSKTGIPLNAEEDGFMPTDALVRKKFGHAFNGGYVAHAAIGQGSVLATPLQVAQMMAGIGNGYVLPKPRLVLQVQDLNNNIIESFPVKERNRLNLMPDNVALVHQGMIDVVNSSAGTAKSSRNDYVTMAGKTGTGQWIQNEEKFYLSWFAGFIPAEDPQYAFAAVCEGNPGEYITGSGKAAPMVGKFFNALYKGKKERGELEGYTRTAVASTHQLPGEDDADEKTRNARRSFLNALSARSIFGRRNR
ncbi:MAG: penicillin-binding transpeptidase domain-containing protein [Verrucomicrobiales bacterium]